MSMTEWEYRNFIDLDQIELTHLQMILNQAEQLKRDHTSGIALNLLEDKQLMLVFEKSSTRTRASFEVAVNQLGGNAVVLTNLDSQLGRGEPVSDTAKVLSRYGDIIMMRTFRHEALVEMAEHASVPVINGLTDYSHPCQVMADIMTFQEKKGDIGGQTIAWVGDCNNMANSWIQAADIFKFQLHISCPEELAPPEKQSDYVTFCATPQEAVKDANLVTTDTWVSMGDENAEYKRELLQPYQVNDELMALAKDDAIFMHCLPAHRGEEVTASVIDGEQSVVWDEAENRLHVQKAILLWCMDQI